MPTPPLTSGRRILTNIWKEAKRSFFFTISMKLGRKNQKPWKMHNSILFHSLQSVFSTRGKQRRGASGAAPPSGGGGACSATIRNPTEGSFVLEPQEKKANNTEARHRKYLKKIPLKLDRFHPLRNKKPRKNIFHVWCGYETPPTKVFFFFLSIHCFGKKMQLKNIYFGILIMRRN